jgi:putative iron-regulated protein
MVLNSEFQLSNSTMRKKYLSLLLILLIGIAGCKDSNKDPHAELKESVIRQYSTLVAATYEDAYNQAVGLQSAITAMVASPSALSHEAAKTAWLAARESYGQTEAFRFSEGPIDDADGPEGLLNAWPLDENYIDYVVGSPNAGIVNDAMIMLDATTLASLNELGGERNIAVGYHAIEFLLWGQDDVDVTLRTPGQRPYTDYVVGGTAANQARRGDFIKVCAAILVTKLAELKQEWEGGSISNYRATLESLDNNEALRRIFTGIGILCKSELAGERIFTALDNQDQEDEHSCFSDNTHRDITNNFLGIKNIYLGTYTRADGSIVTGPALSDLAAEYDATLNADIVARLNIAQGQVQAIPVPFDFALTHESVGGMGPIQTTVNTLQALGDRFAAIADKMGIPISTQLPD